MTGNFDKSFTLLEGILKAQPKNLEALFWQGMVCLFTYRNEQNNRAKITKAKQAEYLLLGKNIGLRLQITKKIQ